MPRPTLYSSGRGARYAGRAIILATIVVVLVGGALMRLLDSSEYPTFGRGWWWAIQTVTTVGYGDVTPRHTSGRIVAAAVMLWGIAYITILVASTTSKFIVHANTGPTPWGSKGSVEQARALQVRLDELGAQLDRIERSLPVDVTAQ